MMIAVMTFAIIVPSFISSLPNKIGISEKIIEVNVNDEWDQNEDHAKTDQDSFCVEIDNEYFHPIGLSGRVNASWRGGGEAARPSQRGGPLAPNLSRLPERAVDVACQIVSKGQ